MTLVLPACCAAVSGCGPAPKMEPGKAALSEALSAVEAGTTDRIELELADGEFIDADLARIGRLKGLKRLKLKPSRITDAGLAHLAGLTQLVALNLSGTEATDDGLAYLAGLTRLEL